jgi:hypothetical protein
MLIDIKHKQYLCFNGRVIYISPDIVETRKEDKKKIYAGGELDGKLMLYLEDGTLLFDFYDEGYTIKCKYVELTKKLKAL